MRFWARDQAASLPAEVVLPVPLTPTRKVTAGSPADGKEIWIVGDGGFEDGAELLLEEGAQLFAAFDGLVAGAVAEGGEDFGGGLDAQIAGKQRGFKGFEGGFVDGAGEGDYVFDFG